MRRMHARILRLIGMAAFSLIASNVWLAAQQPQLPPVRYAGAAAAIPDYSTWVFMGAGMFPSADNVAPPRFSNIFVNPEAYAVYRDTGTWPDRTVIISEKRGGITTRPVTTGAGWGQTGDPLGFELEIKDAARGGWMYYTAAASQTAAQPVAKQSDCVTCHREHAAVDSTFVQFYPRLIDAAKRHGTFKTPTQ
jgi:hypothetical protein